MTVKNKPGKKKPKKIMRKFKSLLAVAAATATALSATAQTQGTTHSGPTLDDATVEKYMREYIGAEKYDGTNWAYVSNSQVKGTRTRTLTRTKTQTSNSSNGPWIDSGTWSDYSYSAWGDWGDWTVISGTETVVEPTETQTGDVLFVEVNDYWKGFNWSATPNLENQLKYGVKAINKVSKFSDINSGKLYSYKADATNRFFFAARTASFCFIDASTTTENKITFNNVSVTGIQESPETEISATSTKNGNAQRVSSRNYKRTVTETSTETQTRTATGYNYGSDKYTYPLRWYNEFSAGDKDIYTEESLKNGVYDQLKGGDFFPVPHSCSNSLEKNHYTNLYPATKIGDSFSATVFLYVPTGANLETTYKTGTYTGNNVPQVFFYVSELDVTLIDDGSYTSTETTYSARLDWDTSFDRIRGKVGFDAFADGKAGVKEHCKIWRYIDKEGYRFWQQIDTKVYDEETKQIYDQDLPNPGDFGYEVTYYIDNEATKYDAAGECLSEVLGVATTNQKKIYVPGKFKISLSLANDFTTKYKPVNYNIPSGSQPEKSPFEKSTNKINNNVESKVYKGAPTIEVLNVGDKFTLKRSSDGSDMAVAVNVVEITGINLANGTISYKLTDKSGTTKTGTVDCKDDIQNLIDVVAKYTDDLELVPGKNFEAKYVLVFDAKDGSKLESNEVESYTVNTDVNVKLLYRSGTPDPQNGKNADKELYTYDISFRPIADGNVAHYHIWKNAEEAIIRIGQPEVGKYTLVGKDDDGNFLVPLGDITPQQDGYIHYRANVALDKKANSGEYGEGEGLEDNDAFFTVEVVMTKQNSYGCVDQADVFKGEKGELVVNMDGTNLIGGEGNKFVNGEYRAMITWSKVNRTYADDDYVGLEPDYYTVYKKDLTVEGAEFEPITKYTYATEYIKDENGQMIPSAYTEVEPTAAQTAADGAFMFTPGFMTDEVARLGTDAFYLADFISNKEFYNESKNFPAQYYVTAHYDSKVPTASKAPRFTLADEAVELMHDNLVEKNSDVTNSTYNITTGVEEVNVDSEVVNTVYYNLQGVEVMNPAAGDIVVARYQHADGSITSKVIRK